MSSMQFMTADSKVKFSNHTYDKGIFFDEKKKRFVDFADMDHLSYSNYNKPFTTYRPDYFGFRSIHHDRFLFGLSTMFLNQMTRMRTQEFGRMYVLFRHNTDVYIQPLMDYHIKMGNLDKYNQHRYLKWDDASLSVAYLEYVLNRIKKYGLNYGPLGQSKFPNYKDTLRNTEQQLTDYFLYEMRKEPAADKVYPAMPIQ